MGGRSQAHMSNSSVQPEEAQARHLGRAAHLIQHKQVALQVPTLADEVREAQRQRRRHPPPLPATQLLHSALHRLWRLRRRLPFFLSPFGASASANRPSAVGRLFFQARSASACRRCAAGQHGALAETTMLLCRCRKRFACFAESQLQFVYGNDRDEFRNHPCISRMTCTCQRPQTVCARASCARTLSQTHECSVSTSVQRAMHANVRGATTAGAQVRSTGECAAHAQGLEGTHHHVLMLVHTRIFYPFTTFRKAHLITDP